MFFVISSLQEENDFNMPREERKMESERESETDEKSQSNNKGVSIDEAKVVSMVEDNEERTMVSNKG